MTTPEQLLADVLEDLRDAEQLGQDPMLTSEQVRGLVNMLHDAKEMLAGSERHVEQLGKLHEIAQGVMAAQLASIVSVTSELAAAMKVVDAAREQTRFLVDGYAAQAQESAVVKAVDVRQWMDAHEVKIMDALREFDARKGGES